MVPRVNQKNVIVQILCKDRLKYLWYTWQSLCETLSNIPIIIYDDGSTKKDIQNFLYTNNEFELEEPININNKVLKKYIGHFEPISRIKGIQDKVKVRRFYKSIGNTPISFFSLEEIFEENDYDYIIRLEDDVVFKHGWFDELITQWNEWDIANKGLLCSSSIQNEFRKSFKNITTHLNPTFQCVLIPRYFYEIGKEEFVRKRKFETKTDLYFRELCLNMNMLCGLLPKSICQHIGVESLEIPKNKQDGEYFSSSYDFSKRLDLSVEPPFAGVK